MIYVLEDDPNIRELLVYSLSAFGLPSRGFASPADFHVAIHESVPELVLLDVMLPEEDGVAVLNRLRSRHSTRHVPVIMLTVLSDEYDKVRCLDAGADDYVCKPFGMMELVARVRACLRRQRPSPHALEKLGELEIDRDRHEVLVAGSAVPLTLKEYELLRLLMDNPGTAFSRQQLLDSIWGRDYCVENRTVDVHVRTLRQKLGEAAVCIETVRGLGYRLLSPQK